VRLPQGRPPAVSNYRLVSLAAAALIKQTGHTGWTRSEYNYTVSMLKQRKIWRLVFRRHPLWDGQVIDYREWRLLCFLQPLQVNVCMVQVTTDHYRGLTFLPFVIISQIH